MMPQANDSDALRMIPACEKSESLPACPVKDWVRLGDSLPVEQVPVASIRDSYTPRENETDERHVKILAQSPLALPPIVIHRASMRVIDGVHRLRASELRGDSTVLARFFDGDERGAFALAVHLNVTHGLPLSLSERKAAARKVLALYPHWSDRSIALIAGVSNKTVGKLRGCAAEEIPQLNPRLGRDGKIRPISPAGGRRRAAEYLLRNPRASLRETARKASVSVNTARDVRQRIDKGENPLPAKLTRDLGQRSAHNAAIAKSPGGRGPDLLQRLRNDPSVRSSERGRTLLRLLSTAVIAISACNEFAEAVPIHCSGTIAELARKNARAWQEIADKFDSS
jgi:ParB-like chromosome segregation protein Spo0J